MRCPQNHPPPPWPQWWTRRRASVELPRWPPPGSVRAVASWGSPRGWGWGGGERRPTPPAPARTSVPARDSPRDLRAGQRLCVGPRPVEAFPVTVRAKLFITCIGEQFFPQALKSTVTVLERVGVQCEFPEGQTCCGQPLLNSGFQSEARGIARHWLRVFGSGEEDIVAPSGSCVDMVRHHLPALFPAGRPERAAAVAAAGG